MGDGLSQIEVEPDSAGGTLGAWSWFSGKGTLVTAFTASGGGAIFVGISAGQAFVLRRLACQMLVVLAFDLETGSGRRMGACLWGFPGPCFMHSVVLQPNFPAYQPC